MINNFINRRKIKYKIELFFLRHEIKTLAKVHKIVVGFNNVKIFTEAPGIIIGRGGLLLQELEEEIEKKILIIEYNPYD